MSEPQAEPAREAVVSVGSAGTASSPAGLGTATQSLVLRNTMLLMVAQAIATPLAIVINAVMARYLGPVDFGYIYLAGAFIGFGFLAVDCGTGGMLPALVARNRARAGEVLGSAVAWRLGIAPVVYLLLAAICMLLGYSKEAQLVLALSFVGALVGVINGAYQETIRGFERTDVAATTQVLGPLLGVVVVVPLLLLGGGVHAVLVAQAACGLVTLGVLHRAARHAGVGQLSFNYRAVKELLIGGAPFLAFGVAMVLQPTIDAAFMSSMATPEAVGWHAAARKLIGVLATPASALISALYPTLVRLHAEDNRAFKFATRDALRNSTLLALPLALGCLLYPDIGVRIFSKASFGPTEDNLRIFSVFIFLLYFSMPIGACLAAAGRTKPWAAAQGLCVAVSIVLDPILVPYTQARFGNGGLGICIATVASEALMVGAALILVPKGVLDRTLLKTLALAALAGGAMSAVAVGLFGRVDSFFAAPVALAAYVGCLWLTGGIDAEQLAAVKAAVARKARRKAAA